jgi:hypothetical protein
VLQRGLDCDDLVRALARAGETKEELDLAYGCAEQARGDVVDRLVARDDSRVLRGHERARGGVDRAGDVGGKGGVVVTEQIRDISVGSCGIDEGEEGRGLAVGLEDVRT